MAEADRCQKKPPQRNEVRGHVRTKRTSTAVVRTLRAGETTLGPTEGSAVNVEEGVLLLDTEPGDDVLREVHGLLGVVTVVGHVGGAVVVVALCEDEDVVALAEGVLEDGSGAEVDVGIVAGGLVRGGTVEVPDAKLADVGHLLLDGLWWVRMSTSLERARGSSQSKVRHTVVFERRPPSPSIQTSARRRIEISVEHDQNCVADNKTYILPEPFRPGGAQGRGRGDLGGR